MLTYQLLSIVQNTTGMTHVRISTVKLARNNGRLRQFLYGTRNVVVWNQSETPGGRANFSWQAVLVFGSSHSDRCNIFHSNQQEIPASSICSFKTLVNNLKTANEMVLLAITTWLTTATWSINRQVLFYYLQLPVFKDASQTRNT